MNRRWVHGFGPTYIAPKTTEQITGQIGCRWGGRVVVNHGDDDLKVVSVTVSGRQQVRCANKSLKEVAKIFDRDNKDLFDTCDDSYFTWEVSNESETTKVFSISLLGECLFEETP